MDKVCDTCLYGIRVDGGKLGCLYSGICHTRDGQKTAWTPNKAAQYADLKGRRFRPTFESNIDFFEIRGYDEERDMVLTIVHPKEGSPFEDEIKESVLFGAFEIGEYKPVKDSLFPVGGEQMFMLYGVQMFMLYNYYMPPAPKPSTQKFCGPSCDRCLHRFGTTSNAPWCETHWQQSRRYSDDVRETENIVKRCQIQDATGSLSGGTKREGCAE